MLGLGRDARATDGHDFDLDTSVFLLGSNGKVRTDQDFIFYNNLKSPDGSVAHMGDNRTGAGEGDDEVIKVNLANVPPDVEKIVITVTILGLWGFLLRWGPYSRFHCPGPGCA
jgi:tellurium resistance protein TerD